MSLIIAVYVKEGIVLASDSRTTYTKTDKIGSRTIQKIGVHSTDTTNKTFLCPNNVGLSTCGDASLMNSPITGYIDSFILEKVKPEMTVDETANELVGYFNNFSTIPNTSFLVAGYQDEGGTLRQKVLDINVKTKSIVSQDTNFQGATWNGETQTLSNILVERFVKTKTGEFVSNGSPEVLWRYFTLQDAIEFAEYAVDITIKTMRFINTPKTVGGPIDILVLKPNEVSWIRKKKLMSSTVEH